MLLASDAKIASVGGMSGATISQSLDSICFMSQSSGSYTFYGILPLTTVPGGARPMRVSRAPRAISDRLSHFLPYLSRASVVFAGRPSRKLLVAVRDFEKFPLPSSYIHTFASIILPAHLIVISVHCLRLSPA